MGGLASSVRMRFSWLNAMRSMASLSPAAAACWNVASAPAFVGRGAPPEPSTAPRFASVSMVVGFDPPAAHATNAASVMGKKPPRALEKTCV